MQWFKKDSISREHHNEVVAAKDELIRTLLAQNAVLAVRLEEPIGVTVKLPDGFALVQPAIVRTKARPTRLEDPDQPEQDIIDYSNADENDPVVIAKIAAREMGPGPHNAYALGQVVNRIRTHIREARSKKLRDSQTAGNVGTIHTTEPPEVPQPYIPKPHAEDKVQIPDFVQKLIDEAERVN